MRALKLYLRNWWDLDFEGTADNLHNNFKQNISAVAFATLDKKSTNIGNNKNWQIKKFLKEFKEQKRHF